MQKYKYIILLVLIPVVSIVYGKSAVQQDTLLITEAEKVPTIDGTGSDEAWEFTNWKKIDQIWMPYENDPGNLGQESGLKLWEGEDDFSGKFKVVWSQETNLMYFLVETNDDVFTDGYVYNENPNAGGGYPNYDIVEVFIDEDRSGGLHVFDGTGSVGNNWGTNAENAFSYHLAANEPGAAEVQTQFHALDIAGTNWGYPNQKIADYASHFPNFALKREGNKFIWEFSLRMYNDSYDHSNQGAFLVTLEAGKIMGLSIAYCDNDNPDESPLKRDHFFGSVEVPAEAYNDHWKQADGFGVAKLVKKPVTSSVLFQKEEQVKVEAYLAGRTLFAKVNSAQTGNINIRVFNILGREMLQKAYYKPTGVWNHQINLQNWKDGIYLVEVVHGNKRSTQKIFVR